MNALKYLIKLIFILFSVGIVVIADPGTVPINSRGEKQRMHLRDGFLADQLDPIYVAYNM